MVADVYATTGASVLTILDCRLLGRHDEHLPFRFTRAARIAAVANDPADADQQIIERIALRFQPPNLEMIEEARHIPGD